MWRRAKHFEVNFGASNLEQALSGFFWVFDRDLKNNLAEFSGQIRGVKQGSQLSQQLEELGGNWAEILMSTFGQFLQFLLGFLWVIGGESKVNFPEFSGHQRRP